MNWFMGIKSSASKAGRGLCGINLWAKDDTPKSFLHFEPNVLLSVASCVLNLVVFFTLTFYFPLNIYSWLSTFNVETTEHFYQNEVAL